MSNENEKVEPSKPNETPAPGTPGASGVPGASSVPGPSATPKAPAPRAPGAADPSGGTVSGVRVRAADPLDTEYRYYSKLLSELIIMLTKKDDRDTVLSWVHKLSSAGYNVSRLRDKRNRYTIMLCMSLLQDTIDGPFVYPPPVGVLPDILKGGRPQLHVFEWEKDTTWEEELKAVKEIHEIVPNSPPLRSKCHLHRKVCPRDRVLDEQVGEVLDKQFQFLLYISKPYTAMLRRGSDRIRAAKWIQALCSVDRSQCIISKGVRNDYMMILVGHLANQDLVFPFDTVPTEKLEPLQRICAITEESRPVTDPTHPRTSQFFMDIPTPDEGAFAFLAVTGDLYGPKNQ